MRKQNKERVKDYWASFTDVITNLLLIFIFIFIVLIIKNYFDNVEIKRLREVVGTIEDDLEDLKSSFKGFEIEGPDETGNLRIVLGEDLVKFASDSYDIYSIPFDGQYLLKTIGEQIKSALQKHPSLFTITIEGYTDRLGSNEYNYNLSYRRAKNVMIFWLDEIGLDPNENDITPAGFGELYSKLRIKTPDNVGSIENRRIEIRITPKFKELMQHLIK
jgi:outer membrane protein OmpA-like peptidoglycan-associated protein